MKRFDIQRQLQLAWVLLFLLIAIYSVEMSYQAVLRYLTFKATAYDLGNMDQAIWNTLHGRPFQFTNQAIDFYGPPTRLAQHFEPILFLLSLLYVFGANPMILLVFQTLALASGAVPVFLLTRRQFPTWPLLAPVMALVYLLSPALLGLNIFDFHPLSLATPLLLYAALALANERYGWFLCACFLAAACKEDVPMNVAMYGVLLIWKYKKPRLGSVLIVGGLLWAVVAIEVIGHFYTGVSSNNFWYRYAALGASPQEAIVNILLHPWILITTYFTFDRLYYLASLFRSGGFMCVLAPEWLLPALPSLAINLMSTNDPTIFSGVYHYNAAIIPFVMLATLHGLQRFIILWRYWRGEYTGTLREAFQKDTMPVSDVPPTKSMLYRFWLVLRETSWQKRFAGFVFSLYEARFLPLLLRCLSFIRHLPLYQRLVVRLKGWLSRVAAWLLMQWQGLSERMVPVAKGIVMSRLQQVIVSWIALMIAVNLVVIGPQLNTFWATHLPGSREQHIQQLLDLIPPDASVSASQNLNPHLSERQHLAVFPSISDSSDPGHTQTVQYIIVDLYSLMPEDREPTNTFLNQLTGSSGHPGTYMVLRRAEGVVLLVRRSQS